MPSLEDIIKNVGEDNWSQMSSFERKVTRNKFENQSNIKKLGKFSLKLDMYV